MERFTKALLAGAAIAALVATPAAAQSPSPAIPGSSPGSGGSGWGLGSPFPPADSGKPMVFDAPARLVVPPPSAPDCGFALACQPRLEGVVRRGGAVELKVTPFSW
jgi:hypothetical protein